MPLSAIQETDRETRYNELDRQYQTLTAHIAALNTDIGRELDAERKLTLTDRRNTAMAERKIVTDQMHEIESRRDQSRPRSLMNGAIPYSKSGYFYSERFIADLVDCQDLSLLKDKDGFVLYSEALRPDYYVGQKLKVPCRREGTDYERVFPYRQWIDFTHNPQTSITIVGDIAGHSLRRDIARLTDEALNKFLAKKPETETDPPVLRMVYLKKLEGKNSYQCCLECANYGSQVRTNLTIDYPISFDDPQIRTSLRELDLDLDQRLKPLEQSVLVNSVGVSAVVFYRTRGTKHFFVRYRPSQGIFSHVLGTLSCAVPAGYCQEEVQNARGQKEPREPELIRPLKKALEEKFEQEVGLTRSAIIETKPLAFALELIRGGKPQFFFLIEIAEGAYPSVKECQSASSTIKFINAVKRGRQDRRTTMSPEFVVNLLYAWKHFQVMDGISDDVVVLP